MQLIKEHSATIISACWTTVDWSWPDWMGLMCTSRSPNKKKQMLRWLTFKCKLQQKKKVLVCCLNALNSNQTKTPDDMKTQTDKECRKIHRKIPPDKNYKCYKKYSSTVPAQCHLKLVKVIEVRIFLKAFCVHQNQSKFTKVLHRIRGACECECVL